MKNLDKWLHALAAMGIFLVAAFVSHYWMIGVAIAMGAGLMKEIADTSTPTTVCPDYSIIDANGNPQVQTAYASFNTKSVPSGWAIIWGI